MSLREELVEACHKVYEKGFVVAFDGNLSARIDENRILITRSGINKGDITLQDILTIDNEGNLLEEEGKVVHRHSAAENTHRHAAIQPPPQ